MKKQIIFFFLLILLIGCKKNTEPSEPDVASIVAGNYKLIKAIAYSNDVTNTFKSTLIISRITSNSIESVRTFPSGTSPLREIWELKKIDKDVIEIKGEGGYVSTYRNGQIPFYLGDGILELVFEKDR